MERISGSGIQCWVLILIVEVKVTTKDRPSELVTIKHGPSMRLENLNKLPYYYYKTLINIIYI